MSRHIVIVAYSIEKDLINIQKTYTEIEEFKSFIERKKYIHQMRQ